jgi:EAL domain-containing protein (putative c-di-GMP-specific phosphodiesterase class I)
MGDGAAELCREAKAQGKYLHMGRVNTQQRIRYAQSLGCDSIDGTAFSMYRKTYLPHALRMNQSGRQLAL